jgi:hypothetical protein
MDAKVLIINDTSEWKKIKDVHNIEINILIILLDNFLIEIEALGHLPGLMIAPQHKDIIFVVDFHGHK